MKNRILSCMVIFVILASCQEKAKEVETQTKADIRFDSHPVAESHRTVISEKYNAGEANFASHYVIVTWGCGSGLSLIHISEPTRPVGISRMPSSA